MSTGKKQQTSQETSLLLQGCFPVHHAPRDVKKKCRLIQMFSESTVPQTAAMKGRKLKFAMSHDANYTSTFPSRTRYI